MTTPGGKLLLAALASASLAACQQGSGGEGNQAAAANRTATADSASGGGGAPQAPATKTIAETISQSGDHTSLVRALKSAGLVETLAGAGPYTVFAPTNAAFQKLPAGAAEGMMKPDSKAQLTALLTNHVVPGVVTAQDLAAAIERGGGKAQLATVGGGTLMVSQSNGGITVNDPRGGQARVTQADQAQSNGVVHVVDGVLMPKEAAPAS